jgi:hypothetical protein
VNITVAFYDQFTEVTLKLLTSMATFSAQPFSKIKKYPHFKLLIDSHEGELRVAHSA